MGLRREQATTANAHWLVHSGNDWLQSGQPGGTA